VLSLAPLKHLVLSARVVPSKPHPQPPSTEPAPPPSEEVPVAATATEASIAPPLPFPAAAVEEGEAATKAPSSRAALVHRLRPAPVARMW
jgi:hypothetical protein